MSELYIKNAFLITMNEEREVYEQGAIFIKDNVIKAIGNFDENIVSLEAEVYDAKGKILMPGLVNTHVHLSQQLGRGIADDVDLLTWLRDRVWPYESSFDYEDSLISSTACCIEMIKSGVTTFLESGGQYVDAMVEAVNKTGIRACLAKSVMDEGEGLPKVWQKSMEEELKTQIDLFNKYNDTANGRIKIWFALRTIFNNSDELIIKTKELADNFNTGIHMHIGEIADEVDFAKQRKGLGTVEHLNSLGVLGSNLLAVHTVWLTNRELDLFRLNDVKVSHNPAAAMKVVLGFASIPEMIHKGITVSIGTDGAPSNNRMDMMRDMYLTSLIHKGRTLNPTVIPAEKILEMATINGAKCALLENEIGSLEVGKKADMIILNPNTIHTLPMHNLIGNIVYSMSSENVDSTICDGKWLMKERKVLVIKEEVLLEKVKLQGKKIKEKANIEINTTFKVIKK
ncbi:amidohydrolase [Clostridium tarantellae]|uniref:Amidohydrolase family protein n=1 Tax=Clostridium tarantellae TaxID=39493 RepID=A0A6I1MMT3_9CLOT|nr:amidohydrolase [Clostridium tarantellae]MPQ44334.1 amidohydrolase family protein [Clostridium tarantellae]